LEEHSAKGIPSMTTVRLATPAELPIIRARWHETWGDGLTASELLEEEALLDTHAFCLSGRRKHYVLCRKIDDEILCSCEVLLTPAQPQLPSFDLWHIACLYTSVAHRGRGHASTLLKGLRDLADQCPLILYSDIGPKLYEGLGFRVPDGHRHEDLLIPSCALPSHRDVELLAYDTDLSLLSLPAPKTLPGKFTCLLTPQRLSWLCGLEAWRAARGHSPQLSARGATLPGTGGLIVWASDASAKDLVVLLLRAGDALECKILLNCAQSVAAEAGLARVRVWDDYERMAERAMGLLCAWKEARPGKLPMIACSPHTPSLDASSWLICDRGCWY